ncbi:phosphatidylserine decarboxylase [Allonocardiopsis opalescens]|uniref:Phosphatidylserine decarboxylase n=1 Tax=Allonocardiopsis opalescens TaxID=1144618 RepID=A0A2T0PU02_9ACTN|nr:phosphatidylserine decarboxylase [Allonocardiopsis opalescens]PRX92380.1 phosphatidylserine decarboxylase [Allonocardiopsis opalescens]
MTDVLASPPVAAGSRRRARRPRGRPPAGPPPWLLAAGLGLVGLTGLAGCRRDRRWAWAALPALAAAAVLGWTGREPRRPVGSGRLLAPADGVVQGVRADPDGRTRVATFVGPLQVPLSRAPIAGVVSSVRRVRGGAGAAFGSAGERNERVVWHLDTELGDVEVVQIAGATGRRIATFLGAGDKVEGGTRIGRARAGSRVDVYLPPGVTPAVRVGMRVRAGQTRLDRD